MVISLNIYDNPAKVRAIFEQPDYNGKDSFWYLLKYELHAVLNTKIYDLYMT